jgi:hypothetical protein
MDHGGLVQMREFGHIICFVEFGGIDLIDLVRIDFSLLLGVLATRWGNTLGDSSVTYLTVIALDQQSPAFHFF